MSVRTIVLWLLGFVFFLQSAGTTSASEGRISVSREGVNCEAISIWKEGAYRIFGKCHGLIYPYTEGYSNYVLWGIPVASDKSPLRIASIDEGLIDGRSDDAFSRVYITAERQSFPANSEGFRIIEADVTEFPFVTPVSPGVVQGVVQPPVLVPLTPAVPVSTPSGFSFPDVFSRISVIIFLILAAIVIGIILIIWRASTR